MSDEHIARRDFEAGDFNRVMFCDETARAGVEVAPDAYISVTLTSHDGDTQWGEFLTFKEAVGLYRWLDLLVGDGTA